METMNISIEHPTNRPNYSWVTIGDLTLAFSYETVIGFHTSPGGWQTRQNVWGPTTGKHLNWLRVPKDERLDSEAFILALDAAMWREANERNYMAQ
jgi:hypothetical protein